MVSGRGESHVYAPPPVPAALHSGKRGPHGDRRERYTPENSPGPRPVKQRDREGSNKGQLVTRTNK